MPNYDGPANYDADNVAPFPTTISGRRIIERIGAAVAAAVGSPNARYIASIIQSGGSDPVATVMENAIGNIVWTLGANGEYIGTLAGSFTVGKTFVNFNNASALPNVELTSVNVITLFNGLNNGPSFIEIKVYP